MRLFLLQDPPQFPSVAGCKGCGALPTQLRGWRSLQSACHPNCCYCCWLIFKHQFQCNTYVSHNRNRSVLKWGLPRTMQELKRRPSPMYACEYCIIPYSPSARVLSKWLMFCSASDTAASSPGLLERELALCQPGKPTDP